MRGYELHLPVWKQGDDLADEIKGHDGNVPEGFEGLAQRYEEAAATCRRMANLATLYGLKVEADCHMIKIEGRKEVLEDLVEQGLLSSYEWDDEDDSWEEDMAWDDEVDAGGPEDPPGR